MKTVLTFAAALALLGATTLPSLANYVCIASTSHVADGGTTPPECLVADTKTKHPDWYRDGGYCDSATTTVNVTAFSSDDCPV